MSENRVSSESNSLITELKSNIESRKHALTHYKKFIIGLNADSENITIQKSEYNNLLEDFENTIFQSLQAIKSLEIENLNFREIIAESRKENEYRHPFDDQRSKYILTKNEDLSNYRINSPSFLTKINLDYNTVLEKCPEMTFSNEFNEKEEAQNLREGTEAEGKSNFCREYDINTNSISSRNQQDPEYLDKKINYRFETEVINNHKMKEFEVSSNADWAKEFKLNFDYSQIKDYVKFLGSASDLKKIEYIDYSNTYDKYTSYGITNKQDNKDLNMNENVPLFYDLNYEKKENESIGENIPRNKNGITDSVADNLNLSSKGIIIKEGLRNKIKNKSDSMKNSLNHIEISDNSNLNQMMEEEDTIQFLNNKKTSFVNKRFDINKLINKINSDERLIEFLAFEYGDGNYEIFLHKLEREQLDTSQIEKIINYFTDIKHANSSNFKSNDSKINNFNKSDDSKLIRSRSNRNFKTMQNESTDSRNSRRNNSSQREYKNDVYIEPIKLENFLRSDKPDKTKYNSNSKLSKMKLNENRKMNDTIAIPKKPTQ